MTTKPLNPNLRAEDIRKRRVTRTQSRLERAARGVLTPPTTMRGTHGAGMGQPVLQRTASHPRRVYTVAMPMQRTGHALSMHAPTIHLGWRALSGVIVLGLIGLLIFGLSSDQFKVDRPQINGATRVSANDIEAVLKLNGRSIFSIDPQQITSDLGKSFPELQGVSLSVALPNAVQVQFSERQPVLAWSQKGSPDRWIDARGSIFAARGNPPEGLVTVQADSQPPAFVIVPTPGPTPTAAATPNGGASLPSATATPVPDRIDLNILASALTLNQQKPDQAKLIYAGKEGLGWHDSRGWDVYFGKTLDNLEMKISMVQAIIKQLGQKGINPTYVNLESLQAPYYRLEH